MLLDSVRDSDGPPAAGRILDVARVITLPDLKPARVVFYWLVLTCLAGTPPTYISDSCLTERAVCALVVAGATRTQQEHTTRMQQECGVRTAGTEYVRRSQSRCAWRVCA